MTGTLIIGYGNELRSDDGVGPAIAKTVEAWNRPDIKTIATGELMPELVEAIAHSQRVLFVDAAVDAVAVRVDRLLSIQQSEMRSHAIGPRELLNLADVLYGSCPPAWLLSAPASDFGIGTRFSQRTSHYVPDVLDRLRRWIDDEAEDA